MLPEVQSFLGHGNEQHCGAIQIILTMRKGFAEGEIRVQR
jgi:hypothetical protein